MTKFLRMSKKSYDTLVVVSSKEGISPQKALALIVDRVYRDLLMEEANLAYETAKSNPTSWNEELLERSEWDSTILDGLETEEN